MKILVVCQYYFPEPFRITDVCEELVRRGHDVTVVTGLPNYPEGKIYSGYQKGEKREETVNGVKIRRCFTVGRKGGAVKRLLNYFSYPFSACRYVGKLKDDYDAVFVNQLSPVMMAYPAIKYRKKYHKKLVLYCLDLWPASLRAGGVSPDSLLYKGFGRIAKRIYGKADLILNTSRSFEAYQREKLGLKNAVLQYLPQYAESLFSPDVCRKAPDGYIDLMFAGNIGYAQSVQTVIKAANLLQKEDGGEKIRWHIVGDGTDLENCKQLASELNVRNMIFYGRRPLEAMPDFYAKADAMLVTMQKDDILSLTLPGKVQGYMSAGKPIIASADGETPLIISEARCGYCAPSEDEVKLAECVRCLIKENDTVRMGENARAYYEEHFSKEQFFQTLEKALE